MKLLVPLLLLCLSICSTAQDAVLNAPSSGVPKARPPASAPRSSTSMDDAFGDVATTTSGISALAGCANHQRMVKNAYGMAQSLKEFDNRLLTPLGRFFSALHIYRSAKKGQNLEAGQSAAAWAIDETFCASRPDLCPAWATGRFIGQVISDFPKAWGISDRTLNEMWTDYLFDVLNSKEPVKTIEQIRADLRRRYAEQQQKAATAAKAAGRCPNKDPDYETATRYLLEPSSAGAVRLRSSASQRPARPGMTHDCSVLDDFEQSRSLMQQDREAWQELNARC